MFPLLSTRANPLGPLLLCDRTSPYPANMQREKTIRGMPKRITIPPGGPFEFSTPKCATATISIGMTRALVAVSLVNFQGIHANAGPKRGPAYLSRILAFTGKVGAPHCQRGVRRRSRGPHVDSMMSTKNREMKQAR